MPHLTSPVSISELDSLAKTITGKWEYRRLQSILLRLKFNKSFQDIAALLNIHPRTVQKHWYRFKTEGIRAFESQRSLAGRKPLFSQDELNQTLQELQPLSNDGQLLSIKHIQTHLQEKTGKRATSTTVWKAVKRMKWSKQRPRPVHPKSDKEAQSLFKKTF